MLTAAAQSWGSHCYPCPIPANTYMAPNSLIGVWKTLLCTDLHLHTSCKQIMFTVLQNSLRNNCCHLGQDKDLMHKCTQDEWEFIILLSPLIVFEDYKSYNPFESSF